MIGQRVTVMRDGKVVGTLPVDQADEPTLVSLMVGRRLTEQYPKEKSGARQARAPPGRSRRARAPARASPWSCSEGEILGIFGLMGAGQPELARAIFGLERIESRATCSIDEKEVRLRNPAEAIRHGIGLLTRDRRQSLVPVLPMPPNVTPGQHQPAADAQPAEAALREPGGGGIRPQPAHPAPAAEAPGDVPERGQPAEGRAGALAVQPGQDPDVRRADPRHRRRGQGRSVRPDEPADREAGGDRDDLLRDARDPGHGRPHPRHARRAVHRGVCGRTRPRRKSC